MHRTIRFLSALTVSASALLLTPAAQADEAFSVHLDLGATQPLNSPQDNLYQTGPSMTARGLFNLKPWFNLGPVVSASYFPKAVDDGSNAGILWQLGLAARLQRTHDLMGHDSEDNVMQNGVWSPYINLDLTAAHTGQLWRPAAGVQVGLDFATDNTHNVWFGPYLGYTHVFQTSNVQDGQLLDSHDVNLLTAGISFTFDVPQRTRTVATTVHDQQVVRVSVPGQTVVVHDQVAKFTNPPSAPAPFELKQHVYFDWDSSKLRWESVDKLDEVIAALKGRPGVSIHVAGHASSDGQKTHNEKLAAARAAAVRDYLVSHGIDASRLSVESFGVDRTVGDQKKPEGRERSRRVEFEITVTAQ